MDIRDEIRSILKEVFSEAAPTKHYKDRVEGRLKSTEYTRPTFNYNEVENQINILKNTNFDPQESFAIFLKSFPVTYASKDPYDDKISVGDELWAVVRSNEITTIFFRNSSQRNVPVKGVDNTLEIKTLYKNYVEKEKNQDGTVDFSIYSKNQSNRRGPGRKKIEIDLPIVDIDGSKWYIDQENEKIIFVKNTKKEISFDNLKEEYLEKIIDAVTS